MNGKKVEARREKKKRKIILDECREVEERVFEKSSKNMLDADGNLEDGNLGFLSQVQCCSISLPKSTTPKSPLHLVQKLCI